MPRLKRRRLVRNDLSERTREHLLGGHDFEFLAGEALDTEGLRDAWEDHGEDLLASFIAEHPGRRPWGWWRFEALEQRRRNQPDGPYTQYRCPASFGVPENCDPAEYETERDYLERLGMMTVAERASACRQAARRAAGDGGSENGDE